MFFIKSLQLRQLIGLFQENNRRVELFIMLFMRVIDIHNEKLFRIRFERPEDVRAIQKQLGFAMYFPFMQPENAEFVLDLSHNDERIAAHILFTLMSKEAIGNVVNYSYTDSDGKEVVLTSGIPRTWWVMKNIPWTGVFRCRYCCAADDHSMATRKALLLAFGYWDIPHVTDEDVEWRMGLHEAPEDVLDFVEFVVGRGQSFEAAFKEIDGPGGNGVISHRELEEGYREMLGKKKPLNAKQLQVITAVFRYLDVTGEGSVSLDEWAVLNNLYAEIKACLGEFVQFCECVFGPDLEDTWKYLDDDESGEISEEEWHAAVAGIGYFGPSAPIFNFLDKDNEGNLSFDEFEALNEFSSRHRTETMANLCT